MMADEGDVRCTEAVGSWRQSVRSLGEGEMVQSAEEDVGKEREREKKGELQCGHRALTYAGPTRVLTSNPHTRMPSISTSHPSFSSFPSPRSNDSPPLSPPHTVPYAPASARSGRWH